MKGCQRRVQLCPLSYSTGAHACALCERAPSTHTSLTAFMDPWLLHGSGLHRQQRAANLDQQRLQLARARLLTR